MPSNTEAARLLLEAEAQSKEATAALVKSSPWHITACDSAEALDVALALAGVHGFDVRFVLPNGVGKYTMIARLAPADAPNHGDPRDAQSCSDVTFLHELAQAIEQGGAPHTWAPTRLRQIAWWLTRAHGEA